MGLRFDFVLDVQMMDLNFLDPWQIKQWNDLIFIIFEDIQFDMNNLCKQQVNEQHNTLHVWIESHLV